MTDEALARVAAQVEALTRVQFFTKLRDEALAELQRLDGAVIPSQRSGSGSRPPISSSDHLVSRGHAAQALAVSKKTITRWVGASGHGRRSPTGALLVDLPALRTWRNGQT